MKAARGIFQPVETAHGVRVQIQTAPFRFGADPPVIASAAPEPGADQALIAPRQSIRRVTA